MQSSCRLGSREQVTRALTAHARVRLVCLRRLVWQIGELVHDCLGLKAHHRFAQCGRIERVADHRLSPQGAQPLHLPG